MESSEAEVIEKDRRQFPHCYYSTSVSQTCSASGSGSSGSGNPEESSSFFGIFNKSQRESTSASPEGAFVCETIRRIQRNCPGEAPVSIFVQKSQSENDGASMIDDFDSKLPMNPFHIFGDVFGSNNGQGHGQGHGLPFDPFAIFGDLIGGTIQDDIRRGGGGGGGLGRNFPRVEIPEISEAPHKASSKKNQEAIKFKGRVSGPVEEA